MSNVEPTSDSPRADRDLRGIVLRNLPIVAEVER